MSLGPILKDDPAPGATCTDRAANQAFELRRRADLENDPSIIFATRGPGITIPKTTAIRADEVIR